MAVVCKVGTVGRNDIDISDLSHFVEARHNEFCHPHLSRTFKGKRGLSVNDRCTTDHLPVNGKSGKGIVGIGRKAKLGLTQKDGRGLYADIELGRRVGAQHQAGVTKENPCVVGIAMIAGMQIQYLHVAVERCTA